MSDTVSNPKHYNSHPSGVECITITEHMSFNLGNAIKYIWRADLKDNAVEDLRKAAWYIDRELSLVELRAKSPKEIVEIACCPECGTLPLFIPANNGRVNLACRNSSCKLLDISRYAALPLALAVNNWNNFAAAYIKETK